MMNDTKSDTATLAPAIPTLDDVITTNDNDEHLKPSFDKRRNTDDGFFLGCSTFNNDLHQRRRHTIVSGVTKKELLEKETKLIVLEFLQKSTPRNDALLYRLESKEKPTISIIKLPQEKEKTEETLQRSFAGDATCDREKSTINCSSRTEAVNSSVIEKNNDKVPDTLESDKKTCKKRTMKKQRRISAEKAKTITIGESERKQIVDEQKSKRFENTDEKRRRYKRGSSDLTHLTMQKKFKEMQTPVIKWLSEHVRVEHHNKIGEEIDEAKEELLVVPETAELVGSSPDSATVVKSKRLKPNLILKIPRRSIFQLIEENDCSPETFAVEKLEKISQEIMRDYGELLAGPIKELLNPIQTSKSITYEVFAGIANQVYDIAISGGILSNMAMLLNTVKEAMFLGELDESQMELLVDHSTKFVTENAPQTLLNEGTWDALAEPGTFLELNQEHAQHSNGEKPDEDETKMIGLEPVADGKDWAPFGMAALTVSMGIAYSYMK